MVTVCLHVFARAGVCVRVCVCVYMICMYLRFSQFMGSGARARMRPFWTLTGSSAACVHNIVGACVCASVRVRVCACVCGIECALVIVFLGKRKNPFVTELYTV